MNVQFLRTYTLSWCNYTLALRMLLQKILVVIVLVSLPSVSNAEFNKEACEKGIEKWPGEYSPPNGLDKNTAYRVLGQGPMMMHLRTMLDFWYQETIYQTTSATCGGAYPGTGIRRCEGYDFPGEKAGFLADLTDLVQEGYLGAKSCDVQIKIINLLLKVEENSNIYDFLDDVNPILLSVSVTAEEINMAPIGSPSGGIPKDI